MMLKRIALLATFALGALFAAAAGAKLPPLSDEAKAKAAETAARTAYNEKVAAFQLCKSMNKTAAAYYEQAKKANKETKPPTPTPDCADPGAFVYTPPEAKPLEAAGAHSPPQTAATPPNTNQPQAATAPAKK